MSGAGLLTGIFTRLVSEVQKRGGDDGDIHHLTTPEADGLWGQIADLIVKDRKRAKNVFQLVVDYDRSLKDSIRAGHYDWIGPSITGNHFPIGNEERGQREISLRLFHFDQDIELPDAIQEMGKKGWRPATIRTLLALGEANPELQQQFPIIALGSVWVGPDNCSYIPILNGDSDRRCLRLVRFKKGKWSRHFHFLAVRK